jgi:hypothetical protein
VSETVESFLMQMQADTIQDRKQELLEQFQTAVSLQIHLWNLSTKIEELLGGQWNVLWRVQQVSTFHNIEREWTESDLDIFISNLEFYNCADGSEPEHHQAMMAKLRYEGTRLELMKKVKDAVYIQRRFWNLGETIADSLRWPLHEVFGRLSAFTMTMDRGTDLTEKDLADFLSQDPLIRVGAPSGAEERT